MFFLDLCKGALLYLVRDYWRARRRRRGAPGVANGYGISWDRRRRS